MVFIIRFLLIYLLKCVIITIFFSNSALSQRLTGAFS